jgi:hypothetical protein
MQILKVKNFALQIIFMKEYFIYLSIWEWIQDNDLKNKNKSYMIIFKIICAWKLRLFLSNHNYKIK